MGFLLAVLAFWLMSREQRKKEASRVMLRAIYVFMVFSFGLVAVGFVRETMDQMQRNQQSETIADLERNKSDLEKSLSSTQSELASANTKIKSLLRQPWLQIGGLSGLDGQRVRVIAEVNGQMYSYPPLTPYATAGADMSPARYPLPVGEDVYQLKFEVTLISRGKAMRYIGNERISLPPDPSGPKEYRVFRVDETPSGPSRTSGGARTGSGMPNTASVLFEIARP